MRDALSQERVLQRPAAWVLLGCLTATLITVSGQVLVQRQATPWWWTTGAVAGLVAAWSVTLHASRRSVRGRGAGLGAWLLITVVCVGEATLPWVFVAQLPPEGRPWLSPCITAAMIAAATFTPRWLPRLLAAGLILATSLVARQTPGWHWTGRELVSDLVAHVVAFVTLSLLFGVLNKFYEQLRVEQDRAERSFREAGLADRITERGVRWDAFIHDNVLATLALISEGDTGQAQASARDSLASLAAGPGRYDVFGLRQGLLDVIWTQYPATTLHFIPDHLDPDLPGEVVEALLDAVSEALRNVARHAYPEGLGPAAIEVRSEPAAGWCA